MREPGFYWVKYNGRWQVAESINCYPTISDGTHETRWLLVGKKRERRDEEFDEIDEHLIIRDERPGYIETSLGRWVEIPGYYENLVNEISEIIGEDGEFEIKFSCDKKLQELILLAIQIKAVQLAKSSESE